jgi:hypothetical protein
LGCWRSCLEFWLEDSITAYELTVCTDVGTLANLKIINSQICNLILVLSVVLFSTLISNNNSTQWTDTCDPWDCIRTTAGWYPVPVVNNWIDQHKGMTVPKLDLRSFSMLRSFTWYRSEH